MTSHTMAPILWSTFERLFVSFTMTAAPRHERKHSPDDARAERDHINEVICNNPNAFSSELDVQNMMHMYSGRV